MPHLKPYKGDFYLWHYVPSVIAAAVVAGCFAILTLWVIWRIFTTRTRFSIPFAIGGMLEVVGYLARIWAAYNTDKLVPYTIQAVLILIPPALLAASVYMVLGRVIRAVNAAHLSIIRINWLTKIFVLTDILSFLVQSSGASLQANQDVNPSLGKGVVLVGLAIQVVAFGLFIITAILFHVRIHRQSTPASRDRKSLLRRTMVMLYIVNGLIMCRSIFRIIEYSMGINSYLFNHEWPLYTFDGEFMMLSMFWFALWYPGWVATAARAGDAAIPFTYVPGQVDGHK
ncbi:hypothetical protein H2200_009882 [Cladophialophora chaetospira]|uniref:Protein RTM1 n=1 Tax=Cladophialophora chaetospira TaxID=386627 RepID=A0AA38X397_9EURO|nr:hypothetical protein H2200_009882 [Cladophialophora chaetospira]